MVVARFFKWWLSLLVVVVGFFVFWVEKDVVVVRWWPLPLGCLLYWFVFELVLF